MQRQDETRYAARRGGFVASILVNAILLYATQHVLEWQIGWITPSWSDVLWAIDHRHLSRALLLQANQHHREITAVETPPAMLPGIERTRPVATSTIALRLVEILGLADAPKPSEQWATM